MSLAPILAEAVPLAVPCPSFKDVFTETAPLVWRMLRRFGVHEADLKDVAQEVFLVVHRRLSTFRAEASARAWVSGICVHVASDYRRRPYHKREQRMDEVPESAMPAAQEAAIDLRRSLSWLDEVLEALDEPKRAVFVLYEIEEVPMAEVAVAVGCPLPTAYARLYAARKHVEAAARREQAKWSPR